MGQKYTASEIADKRQEIEDLLREVNSTAAFVCHYKINEVTAKYIEKNVMETCSPFYMEHTDSLLML